MCSSELTELGPDLPAISHLFSILDESLSLKACQCPCLHTRDDTHIDFYGCLQTQEGQVLENMGVRVSGRQCLQPLYIILITFLIFVPLLIPTHSP